MLLIVIMLGPKYPFNPRDLVRLQRKTDTLTGRELSRRMTVPRVGADIRPANDARVSNRKLRKQLKEYGWKVEDDDDNLREDLLAPKYASF